MYYFNINKKMKYLTDKKLSLNAKGLLSIILFQEEINENKLEKYCTEDNETIKYTLLELKFNRYIKYDANLEKNIASPISFNELSEEDYKI